MQLNVVLHFCIDMHTYLYTQSLFRANGKNLLQNSQSSFCSVRSCVASFPSAAGAQFTYANCSECTLRVLERNETDENLVVHLKLIVLSYDSFILQPIFSTRYGNIVKIRFRMSFYAFMCRHRYTLFPADCFLAFPYKHYS